MNQFSYQNKRDKNYFEGWYFRFTTEKKNYAVIFAITKNKVDPHAFIQLFDDSQSECKYLRFSVEEFHYDETLSKVSIGKHYLSTSSIYIDDETFSLNLTFKSTLSLSDVTNRKSAMGYLSKTPLECFQEVIYLDGIAKGTVNKVDTTGVIYIEKTYGSKFPVQWIWIQSNHSENKSCISFSVGKIPFFGIKAKGFLCVLKTPEDSYHFYTGNLAKVTVRSDKIVITRGQYTMHLIPKKSKTIKLVGPAKKAEMVIDVYESLTSELIVLLYKGKKLIFEDRYSNVGYENMW